MTKKRISPQSAKSKGRRLQHWICKQISELTGYEWGSSGEDKPIESRPMGQSGSDVRMESQVRKLFPFSVEAKNQEKWNIPQWVEQAKENTIEGTDWILVVSRNHYKKPILIIDAEVFFSILKKVSYEDKKVVSEKKNREERIKRRTKKETVKEKEENNQKRK